jgi:hypothetical protein
MDNKAAKLLFSFTDDRGETTTLEKTFNVDSYEDDFGTIYWLLDEFKYFLQAVSFPSSLTDRLVYLEPNEDIVIKMED